MSSREQFKQFKGAHDEKGKLLLTVGFLVFMLNLNSYQ